MGSNNFRVNNTQTLFELYFIIENFDVPGVGGTLLQEFK